MAKGKPKYQYLTAAQEGVIARKFGGHKHWEMTRIAPTTGTATVYFKTGLRVKVNRRGKVLSTNQKKLQQRR